MDNHLVLDELRQSVFRSIASVSNTECGSYDVNHEKFGERHIPLHEYSWLLFGTRQEIEQGPLNLKQWSERKIGDNFARLESAAFVNGDGMRKPRGFMTYPALPHHTTFPDLHIGYVRNKLTGYISADDLINLTAALDRGYRKNGTFVMSEGTAKSVRLIRDDDGQFLWSKGRSALDPDTLLGYPVLVLDDMPDLQPVRTPGADRNFPIAFGDFSAGYYIAQCPYAVVYRDGGIPEPEIAFEVLLRVGGDVVDFDAIKLFWFVA